jgi:3-phenylpropionate/cinnamic acid dioxygenase small subunit
MDDWGAIVDLLAQYASIPDAKNWDAVAVVFADEVQWDFSSLGVPVMTLTPRQILDAVQPGFMGCLATHHSITNHRIAVEGDRATIRAHIRAEHWIDPIVAGDGPDCWLVVGFYDDEAIRTNDGWRLSSVRLTVNHDTGRSAFSHALESGQRMLAEAAAPPPAG